MAREDVGNLFSGCLARQMARECVDDPFSWTDTYDTSAFEPMSRFNYPSLRYAFSYIRGVAVQCEVTARQDYSLVFA